KRIIFFLAFLIILSFVIPALQVGRTSFFRLDRIVQLFTFPILLLNWEAIKKIRLLRTLFYTGILIFVFAAISNFFGDLYYAGGDNPITFPLLVFSKVLIFIFF